RNVRRLQAAQRRGGGGEQRHAALEQPRAQARGQLMKLTDLFIRRPVLAVVVNLVILIAGLQSIRTLAVRQYPRSDVAVINVSTADAQFAAMYIGISSAVLDQSQITDYLTRVVQPKLSAISGVQRADILGDRTFAMRVWLKPEKMAALRISATDVRTALARGNYLSALGRTKGSMVSVNLIANTDLKSAEEFRQIVVKEENGVIVRPGEIADVVLGAENYDTDGCFSGQTDTFMGTWVLPTVNSLEVVKRVREALPDIQAQLPAGIKAAVAYDSTVYIQNAI